MEGADQVLALRRVDAGLAADRGIDLGEQRGRHLHHAHAAPQDAGGEAGEIADHAAAERNDAVAPLDAELEQALAQRASTGKLLLASPGAHHRLAEKQPMLLEARFERGEIKRRDIVIAHDGAARAGQRRGDAASGRGDQPLADDDGIAPSGKRHLDGRLALACAKAVAPSRIISPSCGPGLVRFRLAAELDGDAHRSPPRRSRHGARRGSPP